MGTNTKSQIQNQQQNNKTNNTKNNNSKTNNTNNTNNDINYIDTSNKKSTILSNKQSRKRIKISNLKDIPKIKNLINSNNNWNNDDNNTYYLSKFLNRNKKKCPRPKSKINNRIEIFDSNKNILSPSLSHKNYNKTLSYFKNRSKKKVKAKQKIENYSQNKNKSKNQNFEGVCLNNLILEDIKEKIKFPIYEYNKSKEKKEFIINKRKKSNKFIIYKTIYNSISNKKEKNKLDNKESFSSISEEYLKTMPLLKMDKEKKDKE